jgi:hypothetical protein
VTRRRAPAFYALAPGGWRDYVTLLHPPYTAWHLSYVVIGAALAPVWRPERLVLALAAFFLGVGIAAHALDELTGRPLRTAIPDRVLVALAAAAIAGACAIGIVAAVLWHPWLLAFVVAGAVIVVAYNLELFGGRLHTDAWFAVSWGGLPLLTSYFAASGTVSWAALLAAAFASLSSLAQRRLSTPVRQLRRARIASGAVELDDVRLTRESLIGSYDGALQALCAAILLLAVALVVLRAV